MQQRAVVAVVLAVMLVGSSSASSSGSTDDAAVENQTVSEYRTVSENSNGSLGVVVSGELYDVSLVKEINPGVSFSPSIGELTVVGDRVVFAAEDGVAGRELWVTDGTAAGTTLLKDIQPGSGSSNPAQFTVIGNQVVFAADDGISGRELWISDGTAVGTSMVRDILPGAVGGLSTSEPYSSTTFGDRVLFMANDGVSGQELWVTDGTSTGTTMVKDINSGLPDSSPHGFMVLGDQVLFSADDGAGGDSWVTSRALWVTDGTTAGTTLVKDIHPLIDSFPFRNEFIVFENRLLFVADDGVVGPELWATDGTTAGTTLVKDINPRPSISEPQVGPYGFTELGNRVLFAADGGDGYHQVWVTDGTVAGTTPLRADNPDGLGYEPRGFTLFGNRVLFIAGGVGSGELWVTDGTLAGTNPFKDGFLDGSGFTVFDGRVVFATLEHASLASPSVWITDGTTAGTTPLAAGVGFAREFTTFRGRLLFAGGGVQTELWAITPVLDGRIEDQIGRLYRATFGRAADSAGLEFWADRNRRGFSLVNIAGQFLSSAEFAARHGTDPTNAQVVDALYQNVLGQGGDVPGSAYWTSLLSRGTPRASVLLAFSESPDNVARTGTSVWFSQAQSSVRRLYLAAFGRRPDVAGFAFWSDGYEQGSPLTSIAAQFRTTAEFTRRYGSDPDDRTYVELLYVNVLGRAPDSAGLAYWLAELENDRTRAELLVAFSESPEHVSRSSAL